jgi:hypothetical protein
MNFRELFIEGGFGMYPTSIFGVLMIGAALLYAVRPQRRFVPLLASLGVVTLSSGLLGFSVGVVKSVQAAAAMPPGDHANLVMLGFAESAQNVVLALMLIVLSGLAAAVGAARVARAPEPAL